MNYVSHYERLVSRARDRSLTGYRERHHVLPKCMGGGNEAENIVELTAEEHYVAHQLLVKIYPGVRGLALAAIRMAKQCTGSKAYGWLRRRHSIALSKRMQGNTHTLGKSNPHAGIKHSAETREKMSASHSGQPLSPKHCANISIAMRGNKRALGAIRSPETRAKISAANTGKRITPEQCAKLAAAHRGKKQTQETRDRRRTSLLAYWAKRRSNIDG